MRKVVAKMASDKQTMSMEIPVLDTWEKTRLVSEQESNGTVSSALADSKCDVASTSKLLS